MCKSGFGSLDLTVSEENIETFFCAFCNLKGADEKLTAFMALQPEGRVNAEARLLAGEVQLERGNFDDAGKAFKGVALLYDDPAITPRALDKAAGTFLRQSLARSNFVNVL
jgi:hypothetical protein